MGFRRFRVSLAVFAFLGCLCAAQSTSAAGGSRSAGAPAIVDSIWQASGAVRNAMGALDPEHLHLPRAEQKALLESQDSIARNLREAVPGLIAAFQSAPENLGAAFRLYRDLEVVLLVAQRSADTLPAHAQGAGDLTSSTSALRASLSQLGNWIETRGTAEYARLHPSSTSRQASRPAGREGAQPSPPTLIIDNANAPAPARKQKR